ncbi:MAG: hypothetical protein HYX50_04105 [Chloroflexi bacterium]|nr:hypothetical protein [Chloroflexota bacterium]
MGKDGRPYSLYFGNLNDDPTQWVIVRWQGAQDPCKEGRDDYPPEMILVPDRAPTLRMERIDGSTVYLSVTNGSAQAFDYVRSAFSTQPAP